MNPISSTLRMTKDRKRRAEEGIQAPQAKRLKVDEDLAETIFSKELATKIAELNNLPKLNISDVTGTVYPNLRFILSQTENPKTAKILQASLLALSARITNEPTFNTPAGRTLGFDIQCYGRGIFNEDPKPECSDLPQELWVNILSNLLPKGVFKEKPIQCGLEKILTVSKKWRDVLDIIKIKWVNENCISPETYGEKTASEAIDCIIDKKIGANLSNFRIKNLEIKELLSKHPNLPFLFLQTYYGDPTGAIDWFDSIDSENPRFPNLKRLDVTYFYEPSSYDITSKNLIDLLAQAPNLTALKCNWEDLSHDDFVDSLDLCPKLKSLDLSSFENLEAEDFETIADFCPELVSLRLPEWTKFKPEEITELLKLFPNPIELQNDTPLAGNLQCFQTSGDELISTLKRFPNLISLEVSFRIGMVSDEDLRNAMKLCPRLERLDILTKRPSEFKGMLIYLNWVYESLERVKKEIVNLRKLYPHVIIRYDHDD